MTVAQLQRLRQTPTDGGLLPTPRQNPEGPTFGETLEKAIGQVDASQKTADAKLESFVAGETDDLHDVMISMNQARLTFQLMTEVRNKALDTYQELMRMQV